MKRIILSLFSVFVFFTHVLATPISEGEAREKAMKFMLAKKRQVISKKFTAFRSIWRHWSYAYRG